MKTKIDLKNFNETKIFGDFIYPIFAKEFLFGDSYEDFATIVSSKFILTPKQWESVLIEWELKEKMLG